MVDESKDVHVEVRFRNNRILRRMKLRGISTVAELARQAGIRASVAYGLINMTTSARDENTGEWHPDATMLSGFFGCVEDNLFSHTQQYQKFNTNRIVAEVGFIRHMAVEVGLSQPSHELVPDALELRRAVSRWLSLLPPREERIIRMRFGFNLPDEMTLEEVAKKFRLHRERVRQIEARAIRMLRHPDRLKELEPLLPLDVSRWESTTWLQPVLNALNTLR